MRLGLVVLAVLSLVLEATVFAADPTTELPGSTDKQSLAKTHSAEQRLSANLFAGLTAKSKNENLAISPYGIFEILAVLEVGAAGQTAPAIRTVLGATRDTSSEAIADEIAALRLLGHPVEYKFEADLENNNKYGVRIARTQEGGAADAAKLCQGDLIFSVDGEPVRSVDELAEIVSDSTGLVRISGFEYKIGHEFSGRQVRLAKKPIEEARPKEKIVCTATAVCLDQAIHGQSKFPGAVSRLYSVECFPADFSNPLPLSDAIGRYFALATADRTASFELPKSFASNARLWIANAVTFDGMWATPFSRANTDKLPKFRGPDGLLDVTYLRKTLTGCLHVSLKDEKLDIIELPYEHSNIVMRVFLPKSANDWQTFRMEQWLSPDAGARIRPLLRRKAVDVALPKFRIAQKVVLNQLLADQGLGDLFLPKADFSRIAPARISVSECRQQTFVEIDELGTRAGALTEAELVTASLAPEAIAFHAIHPFFFTIVDQESGVVFFVGRVTTPSSKDSQR